MRGTEWASAQARRLRRLLGERPWFNLGLMVVASVMIAAGIVRLVDDGEGSGSAVDTANAAGSNSGSDRDRDSDDQVETSTTSTRPPTSSSSSSVPAEATGPSTTAPPADPRPVVVIDPGHNGANGAHPEVINRQVDAGGFQKECNTTGTATNDGYTESAFNWAVAQLVRDRLEAAGVDVVLTRDSDDGVGPCIDERGQLAARNDAAALVSIHADGAPSGARGFHVIHPALRAGYTDRTMAPSAELATVVRDTLVGAGFTPSSYIGSEGLDQRDDLGTLNRAGVPAVMLESGNMRDAGDAAWITSDDGRRRLADALADAVLAWLA
jgi:N-acetylmuramoyl-L-alanine amidase